MKFIFTFLLVAFAVDVTYAQWSNSSDNTTSGRILITGGTSSTSFDDISISRNKADAGITIFNTNVAGRSVILFGNASGAKYGYLSHHGSSFNSGTGSTNTYKPSSTVLTGPDVNGLGLVSKSSMWFNTGGDTDTYQRMIIDASGNVGIGSGSPASLLTLNKNGTGAQPSELLIQSNNVSVARFGWNASGFVDISSLYNNNHIVLSPTGTGNVGIGTMSPDSKLSIVGTTADNLFALNASGSNAYFKMGLATDYAWMQSYGNRPLHVNESGNDVLFNAEGYGNVGIGTTSTDAKLTVKGTVHTQEVKVDLMGAVAPDYVFEKEYNLLPLAEVEEYIKANKHLPEVPSAKEMEQDGLNLKEMNLLLLKKVEELTLHLIEKDKKVMALEKRISALERNK